MENMQQRAQTAAACMRLVLAARTLHVRVIGDVSERDLAVHQLKIGLSSSPQRIWSDRRHISVCLGCLVLFHGSDARKARVLPCRSPGWAGRAKGSQIVPSQPALAAPRRTLATSMSEMNLRMRFCLGFCLAVCRSMFTPGPGWQVKSGSQPVRCSDCSITDAEDSTNGSNNRFCVGFGLCPDATGCISTQTRHLCAQVTSCPHWRKCS